MFPPTPHCVCSIHVVCSSPGAELTSSRCPTVTIEFGWQDGQDELSWAIFCPDYYDGRASVREWQFMRGARRTVERGMRHLADDQARTGEEAIRTRNSQRVAKVELATLAIVAPMAGHKAPPWSIV